MTDALSGISAVSAVNASTSLGVPRSALASLATLNSDLENSVAGHEASGIELSTTAQLIETILSISDPPASNPLQTQALIASPAISGQPSTPELAQALSRSVTQSGLFYESHLADWLSGLKSKSDILNEPQAKLNNSPNSQSNVVEGLANPSSLESAHAASGNVSDIIHPETLSLVQQQLQSMDTLTIPWNGQIWPNQQLEWAVHAETYPENQDSHSSSSHIRWKSKLHLTLPHLGEIQAELSLGPQGVQIHLSSDSQQVDGIQSALPLLGQRLQDAGIRAEQLVVFPRSEFSAVAVETHEVKQHD